MTVKYTDEMVAELVKCIEDPLHFIQNYIDVDSTAGIQHVQGNKETPRVLISTEAICAYTLWHMLYYQDQTILFVGNTQKRNIEVNKMIRDMHESVPEWLREEYKTYNKSVSRLDNRSTAYFHVASPWVGQGLSVNMLIFDDLDGMKMDTRVNILDNLMPCTAYTSKVIL